MNSVLEEASAHEAGAERPIGAAANVMSPGHVGFAAILSVGAVGVAGAAIIKWMRFGDVPHVDALLLPMMALTSWRWVARRDEWSTTGTRALTLGRVAYVTLLAAVMAFGVYRWRTEPRHIVLMAFATVCLFAELLPRKPATHRSRPS
ncbi:MAG: hypothetical protein U0Q11_11300 [Vicinamibacterales bacterium]